MACASPHVSPITSSYVNTVRRHVVLGLPLFLLPGGVHRRAIFGILSGPILSTSHLSLCDCFSRAIRFLLFAPCFPEEGFQLTLI